MLFASEYADFGFQQVEDSVLEGGVHSYLPAEDLSSTKKIYQDVIRDEEDGEEDNEDD